MWKDTVTGSTLGGKLYTIEKSGVLYETNLDSGKWKQLGKADFAKTAFSIAADKNIYTIEADGNLYEVYLK